MAVADLSHARDGRFQMDPRDLGLDPLRVEVEMLASAAHANDRAVPSALKVAQVAVFLQMNLREPLHIADSVITRHQQAYWRTLRDRQRIAVERVNDHRLRLHCVFEGNTAAELLIQLKGLLAEDDFLLSAIGPEEHHFARLRANSGLVQHLAQWNAGEAPAGGQTLERGGTIAGALIAN